MFKTAFNDHHITASSENYVSLRDGADDVLLPANQSYGTKKCLKYSEVEGSGLWPALKAASPRSQEHTQEERSRKTSFPESAMPMT
ncbi:hypothetical protein RRF57_011326 [Xylaria bambusicola]|uniref:Uncharacterized protein n=1 Tax=Xylaria bambusicola TaxID=326684 RepID=A0AAN7V4G7_9PEZI